MDVSGSHPEGLLQQLVHERGYGGLDGRVGLLALQVEDDFLVQLRPAAFIAQFLDRFSAQPEMFFNDRVYRAWGRQDDFKPFAQQQAQIALLHLSRWFTESKCKGISVTFER